MLKMRINLKLNFAGVTRKKQSAKERVLKRSGAIVRGIMRRMIKKRKKKSEPGNPPHSHVENGGIKNLIHWFYDPWKQTVVIGPEIDPSKPNVNPVPGVLNAGGLTMVRTSKDRQKKGGPKRVLARIRPRPYRDEALDRFKHTYPELWRDCIR